MAIDYDAGMMIIDTVPATGQTLGDHLRFWRERRRMSQLDLAAEAEISARHLSFLETGRSRASREMALHLGERLGLPLRARNALLIAAGFSPVYHERTLDDPALRGARRAVDLILAGHDPFPALAVDRHWTLVASNAVGNRLFAMLDVAPGLLEPPLNVLRLVLHPEGMARQVQNLPQLRHHLLDRLRSQIEQTADRSLIDLHDELQSYSSGENDPAFGDSGGDYGGVAVPFIVRIGDDILSLITTTTVFGSPFDVTLSELAIETFFPLDAETTQALRRIGAAE